MPKATSCVNEREDDPPISRTSAALWHGRMTQRCNIAICEPIDSEEALQNPKWKKSDKGGAIYEKNKTLKLIDRP